MAKYDVVNGVYRKVAKKYDPVDGVHRNVTKAFEPVDGVYRQYFSSGVPAETLAVGDSVWLNVNGVQKEFLVVHQGNPDPSLYDASCDGTWLLLNGLSVQCVWDSTDNDFANASILSTMNNIIYGYLDANVQSAIKQVKIPYVNGKGNSGAVASGSNGLSTKIFPLSAYEVGYTKANYSYIPADGVCLDYFVGATDADRIFYNEYGNAQLRWLRSPKISSSNSACIISKSGTCSTYTVTSYSNTQPAFILDSSTLVDQSTGINIIV